MKNIAFILIVLMFTYPLTVSAEVCEDCCETVNQIMDDAAKESRAMAKEVMTTYITEPETFDIEKCLAAINSVNVGFSFGLPSLDELLDMACDFVKDQIEGQLDIAASHIENTFSFEAYGTGGSLNYGVGTDGQSDVDFEVQDTSDDIVDAILNSIQ